MQISCQYYFKSHNFLPLSYPIQINLMRLITNDDIIDVFHKLSQRGFNFLFSKFSLNSLKRTKSAFDNTAIHSSNWWIIPNIKKHWNQKITGQSHIIYEEYVLEKYIKNQSGLRMLSLGAGICSHELIFAKNNVFSQVLCVDIADNLLTQAKEKATELGLQNFEILVENVYKLAFEESSFDMVLFNSSLHHFSQVEDLLQNKIKPWLKPDGLLIVNEYMGPNRLQFPKHQIKSINEAISLIPQELRKRYRSKFSKNTFSGSGLIRMYLADPSECVESEHILDHLHSHFDTVEEKAFGGNILMNALKDISHNFLDVNNKLAQETLEKLINYEDDYLKNYPSDFIFGIYKNRK